MKASIISFICIVALSVFTSCGTRSEEKAEENLAPETARKKLEELKIEFNESNFLAKCSDGNAETVRLFIAAGMSPNVTQSPSGKTALILAAEHGSVEVVKALIATGANVNVSSNKPPSTEPRMLYVYPEDLKFPENRKISYTALVFAGARNHDAVIKVLLEAGADPNVRDWMGYTPLNEASLRSRKSVVKALLDGGADPNLGSYADDTPLMNASFRSREIVEMLLDAGADCSKKNYYGKTALEQVQESRHSHLATIEELLTSRCK